MDDRLESVRRMQLYIEKNLYQDITLTDIAKESLFSPWYARKLFIKYLGVSPTDYIRKLRLKNAALKLRDEKIKIIDVALESGFNSVDGFQRAFYKEFGCNPKEYANNPIPISLFITYDVSYQFKGSELKNMNTKNVFVTVIEKPARKVIIKRGISAKGYWQYSNEVGCDIWGILVSMKSMSNEPVCMWLPDEYIKEGTSQYVQGVEVELNYNGIIPVGFDIIELPKSKYLMFQGEPFEEENFEQAITELWEAEKKYDPSIIGYTWDKSNPKIQLEPIGTRGYIELLPIK